MEAGRRTWAWRLDLWAMSDGRGQEEGSNLVMRPGVGIYNGQRLLYVRVLNVPFAQGGDTGGFWGGMPTSSTSISPRALRRSLRLRKKVNVKSTSFSFCLVVVSSPSSEPSKYLDVLCISPHVTSTLPRPRIRALLRIAIR